MPPHTAKYEVNSEPVPGFRLRRMLGQGQFGQVWEAAQSSSGKRVALKIIDLSTTAALKEVRSLGLVLNLEHAHLVPIFEAWLFDLKGNRVDFSQAAEPSNRKRLRELIIAMGLCEKSLADRLNEVNPDPEAPPVGLPVEELLGYMLGAAKGIDFLNQPDHRIGKGDGRIIHCDIKPANLMLVSGEVQIADCGVAVALTDDVRQTRAAFSAAYAAPELTANKPVPGTDQFSLAVTYYELRTGRLPFDETLSAYEITTAYATGRLDFSAPVLTSGERSVLQWATAVRTRERYSSCQDLVKQLARAVEGLPPRAPHEVHFAPAAPPPVLPPANFPPLAAPTDPVADARTDTILAPPLPPPPPPAGDAEPLVLVDPNNPLGARHERPELDPEIAEIIRGSKIEPVPPPRVLDGPPVAELVLETPAGPAAAPPVVDWLLADAPEEVASPPPERGPRRPAPEHFNTIVPHDEVRPAPDAVAKLLLEPAGKTTVRPLITPVAPASQRSVPMMMLGVATVALLTAIGAGAWVIVASSGPVPEPAEQGVTPIPHEVVEPVVTPILTTRDSDQTVVAPPPPPPPPPVTQAERLATFQAQPSARHAQEFLREFATDSVAVKTLFGTATTPELQAIVYPAILDAAQLSALPPAQRQALADWLFAAEVAPRQAELIRVLARSDGPGTDVQDQAAALRAALGTVSARLAPESPAGQSAAQELLDAVEVWQAPTARTMAAYLLHNPTPELVDPFVTRFLGTSDLTQDWTTFRNVRDTARSAKWSSASQVDVRFQSALAEEIQNRLASDTVDSAGLLALVQQEPANGWAAAATLDAAPELNQVRELAAAATTGPPDPVRDQFVAFTVAVNTRVPADILSTFSTLPEPFQTVTRRTRAADVLTAAAMAKQRPGSEMLQKPLEYFAANPIPRSEAKSVAAWLDGAERIGGRPRPDLIVPRTLAHAAAGRVPEDLLKTLAIDEARIATEELPHALAYTAAFAASTSDHSKKLQACGVGARLAARQLERSFVDCPKADDVKVREIKLSEIIVEKFVDPCLASARNRNSPDALSVQWAQIRADLIRNPPGGLTEAERKKLNPLMKLADTLPNDHPDRAAVLAERALWRLFLDYRLADGDKSAIWKSIAADATEAVKLDPTCYRGYLVLSLQSATISGQYSGIAPPPGVVPVTVAQTAELATKAYETLQTRKNTNLYTLQAKTHLVLANDEARQGGDQNIVQRQLKLGFAASRLAIETGKGEYFLRKQLGCIQEDLAWMGNADRKKNYAEAAQMLGQYDNGDYGAEGRVDFARCIVRGIQHDALEKTQIPAALKALSEVDDLIKDKPDQVRWKIEARYLKGQLRMLDGDNQGADEAFLDATQESKAASETPDIVNLYVRSLVQLADSRLRAGRTDVDKVIERLEELIPKNPELMKTYGFAPAYLRGRVAELNQNENDAQTAFAKAREMIAQQLEAKTFWLDHPFAHDALVRDIRVNKPATKSELDRLADLRDRYQWVLKQSELDAINQVLTKR